MKSGRVTALAAVAATSLLLGACQAGSSPEPGPEMGNAVASDSPPATNPAGRVIALPSDYAEVSDMELAGDILGLRSGARLVVGTIADFDAGSATSIEIPDSCADLTATGNTFALACGDEVMLIDAAEPTTVNTITVSEVAPVASASLTGSGELIAGSADADKVAVYRPDRDPEVISVAGPTTQLITVPVDGAPDVAVRTNLPNTTIQDIHWEKKVQGGTLRVGVGIGQIAGGEDGLVVASDTMGDQVAIYTATDVIRLHQTHPVDDSPWGVAWESGRDLALVTSTATNTLAGFSIAQGVPEEQLSLSTIANAHHLVVLPNGTVVIASASGDGLQVIDDLEGA
ncbi:hypothetical protein CATRI_06635 [Corynebacterium atrinae]|uniref:hypothetical protein n=1 Tax=Corynebacterium atrinae TaxID=1336740 RepID=UPI0025B3D2FB|nr:hypothetical protein [Corynebacterium atrinae]WJY63409.1 hypothetical protein CATRI_06635 [Corynebacterium atrinae]